MTGTAVYEFRVGSVLARGFTILFHNIIPFGLLAILFSAPFFVFVMVAVPLVIGEAMNQESINTTSFWVVSVSGIFLYVLLYLLFNATLVYGTIRELRGSRARLRECIVRGLGLVLPVIVVAILMWLAMVLTAIVSIFGVGFVGGLVGAPFIAIPAFLISEAIVVTILWVAIPATVVERPGVLRSLRRSAQLTKGSRWRVFGIIVILFVITIVVSAIEGLLAGAATESQIVGSVLSWIVIAFFSALYAVVSAVSYHDLRIAKEGGDAEQIAAVFD